MTTLAPPPAALDAPPVPQRAGERAFDYYLGVPEPSWLGAIDLGPDGVAPAGGGVPKFVSAARLVRYRTSGDRWPVAAACRYAIDSGAYIALTGRNPDVPWFADPDVYGGMIARFADNNGYPPDFCAPQDYPCEPGALAATGLTVRDHQDLTLDSYLWLTTEFPMVPWIPVLQGQRPGDHADHAAMYADAGVNLAAAHRVGVGSICRLDELDGLVERIAHLEDLAAAGLKLHGFGIKTSALPLIGHLLASADSMAWSLNARKNNTRLPGCDHAGDCRNCYRYAVRWRERVLATMPGSKENPMPNSITATIYPAELRKGDVIIHPGTAVPVIYLESTVKSSRPTVAVIRVKDAPAFDLEVFDPGTSVQVLSRGSVDPLFAGNHRRRPHQFVPLTDDAGMCGECGRPGTPGKCLPDDKTVPRPRRTKQRAAAPQIELFDMQAFAATVSADLGLTKTARAGQIPLADVEWGAYGKVKNVYYPDGSVCKEMSGYVTQMPRVDTGGINGFKKQFVGKPLLHMVFSHPTKSEYGSATSISAVPDTVFTVLEPPADMPLRQKMSLSRRILFQDLAPGDTFYIWTEPGLENALDKHGIRHDRRPRYHVQGPPERTAEKDTWQVAVVCDTADITTITHRGNDHVDVEDPRKARWRNAKDPAPAAQGRRGEYAEANRPFDPISEATEQARAAAVDAGPVVTVLPLFDLDEMAAAVDAALTE